MRAEECRAALAEILQMARRSGTMVLQIASSTREQTLVTGQVTRSMRSIADSTQHANMVGRETVTACHDLARRSNNLERQLQEFQVER